MEQASISEKTKEKSFCREIWTKVFALKTQANFVFWRSSFSGRASR
jgi:hypothetical protein